MRYKDGRLSCGIFFQKMNAAGMARMRAVGSVLRDLPRQEHNKLVAALSRRAAPMQQWGPDMSKYPTVVKARLDSLQTGDIILTSTRVGSWVGNTVQVLTDSTWNHVASEDATQCHAS